MSVVSEQMANDAGIARRAVGGVDRRADLDVNVIDEEIQKDDSTRNLVKLADYEFQIKEINKFVSTYSPNKIF